MRILITLFCVFCGLYGFSQGAINTLSEAIILKTPAQTVSYFSGKGFKKTSETSKQIVLKKDKEIITLEKKKDIIQSIDYDTPDTAQFDEWKKVLPMKIKGSADGYIGWNADIDCYISAYKLKNSVSLVIANRL